MNPNTLSLIRSVPALGALLLAVPVWAAFVIDNVNGTVTDTVTDLVWDRCTWGQTGMDCSSGSASIQNWQAALGVAVNANMMNYKGYNDWRLPSKNELESLVDITDGMSPTINDTAFPNTPGSYFWTSTTYAPDPADAWVVDFGFGGTVAGSEDGDGRVRLVRSGQSFDPSDLLGSLITANASPAGGGTVSCAPNPVTPYVPGGLSASTSTCTATPNAGYSFAGWAGDCTVTGGNCEFTNVTEPKSVTAIFYVPGGGGGVPAVGLWGLSLLAGLLAGLGGFQLRRGRRVRR